MKGVNGEDIVIIEDVTPANSYHSTIKQPQQNEIEEKPINQEFKREVYISLLHNYPPIKIFDMEEYQLKNGLYAFKPQIDGFELEYINNEYNNVLVTPINYLIDAVRTIYFRISEDLFSLFGVDNEDSTTRRIYGCNESRKTFLFLLRDALIEYASFDGRILETRIEWLMKLGIEQYSNLGSQYSLYKYKFEPNFVQWLQCQIPHTEIILPFKSIVNQRLIPNYIESARFVQNATTQLFYSSLTSGVVSYVCEYPLIYSLGPDGNFSEASAVFELIDPKTFEKVLALKIAQYVKRNLEVIQLPGTLVNYNFDSIITELDQELSDRKKLGLAVHYSNMWNPIGHAK